MKVEAAKGGSSEGEGGGNECEGARTALHDVPVVAVCGDLLQDLQHGLKCHGPCSNQRTCVEDEGKAGLEVWQLCIGRLAHADAQLREEGREVRRIKVS